MNQSFSQRQGITPPKSDMSFDTVDDEVRSGIVRLIGYHDGGKKYLWNIAYDAAFSLPSVQTQFTHYGPFTMGYDLTALTTVDEELAQILATVPWNQFFEIIEKITEEMEKTGNEAQAQLLRSGFNDLALRTGCGYEFVGSRLERRMPDSLRTPIIGASQLLGGEAKWSPAESQFEKALGALNRRPPDFENAVKDAVGAVEACFRIASGNSNAMTKSIVDQEPFKSAFHGALRTAIKGIEGYRGDASGVGHGNIDSKWKVRDYEAEYVVAVSGAACTMIIRSDSKISSKDDA